MIKDRYVVVGPFSTYEAALRFRNECMCILDYGARRIAKKGEVYWIRAHRWRDKNDEKGALAKRHECLP